MAERRKAGGSPVELTQAPIYTPGPSAEQIGVCFLYDTTPITVIDVFPGRVEVYGGPKRNSFFGRTSHELQKGTLVVDIKSRQDSTKMTVGPTGQILTAQSPESPMPDDLAKLVTGKTVLRHLQGGTDYTGVSADNPESFERLTFGETVGFFVEQTGLTPAAFARVTEQSPQILTRLLNGDTRVVKSLAPILLGLGYLMDSPEGHILRKSLRRERAKMQAEKSTK